MRLRRSQPAPVERPYAQLGRRIQQARDDAEMSRNDVADRLGVDPIQFAHYEAGEEDPSQHLTHIAEITGTSVARLRGQEPPPAPPEPAAEPPAAEPAGSAVPEMHADEQPAPEPEHIEEEPMAYEFPHDDTPDEPQTGAPANQEDELDFSEDELSRVVAGLSRQRDSLASRRAELDHREAQLDEREQALSEREDHIGAREDAVSAREDEVGAADGTHSAELDAEWQERLQSFEDTNRQYAAATTALAEWAAELRGGGGAAAEAEDDEAAAAEHEEPEHDEPEHERPAARGGLSDGSDFPDDF